MTITRPMLSLTRLYCSLVYCERRGNMNCNSGMIELLPSISSSCMELICYHTIIIFQMSLFSLFSTIIFSKIQIRSTFCKLKTPNSHDYSRQLVYVLKEIYIEPRLFCKNICTDKR